MGTPNHNIFCMSPSFNTPDSTHQLISRICKTWIGCGLWERHTKYVVAGGPQDRFENHWSSGPPSTSWLTCLCGMEHCPAGKNNPQSWGTLSEQKEASFIPGKLCVWLDSFTFHKDEYAWFQPCWSTPWSSLILDQFSQWVWDTVTCRHLQVSV